MPFPNPETQFKPGQSGNPGGRPKGLSLTAIIRDAVEEMEGDKTLGRILIETAIVEARSGNFQFFKEILDRVDGKVIDKVEYEEINKGYDVGNAPEAL